LFSLLACLACLLVEQGCLLSKFSGSASFLAKQAFLFSKGFLRLVCPRASWGLFLAWSWLGFGWLVG
jgi:hypothetical protein